MGVCSLDVSDPGDVLLFTLNRLLDLIFLIDMVITLNTAIPSASLTIFYPIC